MNIQDTALSKAVIHTDKLLDNISTFKHLLDEKTKFMAVVKANAYSHGALSIAHFIEERQAADYFGVAQLSEALALRTEGIQTPILVFNATRPHEIKEAIEQQITLTVFSTERAKDIVKAAETLQKTVNVHLKIDTGMARLGVSSFEEALGVYKALASSYVFVEGIYTHFADSPNETRTDFTQKQFTLFSSILKAFEKNNISFAIRHTCNTAGTINFPDYHLDMVRVGLGLYGLNPLIHQREKIELAPVATVTATITHIKDFPAGESVGYDRAFYSKEPMRIATIAIGYADGVAYSLSNKGHFTYKGQQLPIIGNVCMDQIMLDCSAVSELTIGDEVTYIGDPKDGDTSIAEMAALANESQYDLICRLGMRLNRVYQP